MKEKQIVIHIPESLSHLPVQILRNSNHSQIIFALQSESEAYVGDIKKKYVFVWRQQDYLKVRLDDILWIEADKSYSCIHLAGGKTMTISSNLSSVEKRLPADDFLRIHRSCLINLLHVASLTGNSLRVDGEYLAIGRGYRESVFDRFIFLGIKRKNPCQCAKHRKEARHGERDDGRD